jgi:hypothetical protein
MQLIEKSENEPERIREHNSKVIMDELMKMISEGAPIKPKIGGTITQEITLKKKGGTEAIVTLRLSLDRVSLTKNDASLLAEMYEKDPNDHSEQMVAFRQIVVSTGYFAEDKLAEPLQRLADSSKLAMVSSNIIVEGERWQGHGIGRALVNVTKPLSELLLSVVDLSGMDFVFGYILDVAYDIANPLDLRSRRRWSSVMAQRNGYLGHPDINLCNFFSASYLNKNGLDKLFVHVFKNNNVIT